MIQLSLCIPSYNREKFLPDLLKSIVGQYNENVEIVVCDNGSIDNTEALVRSWQELYPRIIYEKIPQNIGPDRCFLRSVELASGAFCWLLGDDDILEPGGLQKVLDALDERLTGVTVNRAAYDVSLQKRWIEPSKLNEDLFFHEAQSCFSSLFLLFGFLSAQVIHRKKWLAIVKEEDIALYCNAYALIYIIGRMVQKDPSWRYLHTPCVGWRSGNDSFAQELGRYGRFKLDVTGYRTIASGLFTRKAYRAIMNEVCKTHLLGHIRDLKCRYNKSYAPQAIFFSIPKLYDIRACWTLLIPALLFPGILAKGLCQVKKWSLFSLLGRGATVDSKKLVDNAPAHDRFKKSEKSKSK